MWMASHKHARSACQDRGQQRASSEPASGWAQRFETTEQPACKWKKRSVFAGPRTRCTVCRRCSNRPPCPRRSAGRAVRVQEEFLNAALHRVDKDFGGVQAYLVDVLGVDASAQKELAGSYLQR